MATLAQKIAAEKRTRDWFAEYGLPEPDYVEYGLTCIRFFFTDAKVVLVLDIDEPGDAEPGVDVA